MLSLKQCSLQGKNYFSKMRVDAGKPWMTEISHRFSIRVLVRGL